jgi:hypothetical protein
MRKLGKKEKENTDHMSLRISPEIKMKKQRNEELHLLHPTTLPDSSGRRRRILHEFCCKSQSSISCQEKQVRNFGWHVAADSNKSCARDSVNACRYEMHNF